MRRRELVRILLHKARQDEAVLERLLGDPTFDEVVSLHSDVLSEDFSDETLRRPVEEIR